MGYDPNEPRDNSGKWTMGGGQPMPKYILEKMDPEVLTEKEFYKKYGGQHVDLRAGIDENKATENFKSISEKGFNEAYNANAMPLQKGPPTTIIQQRFGAKAGQTVYIIPKTQLIDGANGYKVKAGFKPTKDEVVKIQYDYQPIYEAYVNKKLSEK